MNECTLVTRYKNRLEHLKKVIPSWVRIPWTEMIIVDWTSEAKEDPLPVLKSTGDKRFVLLRVFGQENFNRSASWNVGIERVRTPRVATIDCDVVLHPKFLDLVPNPALFYVVAMMHMTAIDGVQVFPKSVWESVNGYNEVMDGWGFEEIDFQNRVRDRLIAAVVPFIDDTMAVHIPHSNVLRGTTNLMESVIKNIAIAKKTPWGPCNLRSKYDIEEIRPCP